MLYLTPDAALHYLPAFVFAAVFSDRYSRDHAEHVMLILCRPGSADVRLARFHATRVAMLDESQRRLAADVIGAVVATLPAQPRKYWWAADVLRSLERVSSDRAERSPGEPEEPWEALARLRDRIRAVFPVDGIPPVTEVVSDPHLESDKRGAYRLFAGEPWTTASLGQLWYERSAIHDLLPRAYAYYLPAYLCAALDPSEVSRETGDTVQFSARWLLEHRRRPYDSSRWQALSAPQRSVVAEVLEMLNARNASPDSEQLALAARWRDEAAEQ